MKQNEIENKMAKKKVEHTDLPLGLRIAPSNSVRFSNALHASFHMKAYALIDLETDVVTEATAAEQPIHLL